MNGFEPLGLPKGSVRAILALLAFGATVGVYIYSLYRTGQGQAPEWLITLTAATFAWYFKNREEK